MADTRDGPVIVSVILPVFNAESYLASAIESILAQTVTDWQLIAIDDGSNDGSPNILDQFAMADSRMRVLTNNTNLGISAALNRGWREAKGDYIGIAHADDISLPHRLSQQAHFLETHPSVAVVGGATILIDEHGHRLTTMHYPTTPRAIRSALPRHNCIAHPAAMIRRSSLEAVGGYRFDYVEDYDLWLRLMERFDLANLSEALILYRLHSDQLSARVFDVVVPRALTVRIAARTRRRSHVDPLANIDELTPAVLTQLGMDNDTLAIAVAVESINWATILSASGRDVEAHALVERASLTLGPRAWRAYAASHALARAEKLRLARRPLASFAHILLAIRREPRFASARLSSWIGDRLRSAASLRWK